MSNKVKVLFVCMGNICRSPLAHGLFEDRVAKEGLSDRISVDSAGTHAYHVGEKPDPRSQETAMRHGIDLNAQRARKVDASDFQQFDYVIAMDRDNHAQLMGRCSGEHQHKLKLFLEYAPHLDEREVPDPYYGGPEGFEHIYRLIDEAAKGLLTDIRDRHL